MDSRTIRNRFVVAHREARILVSSECGEAGVRHVAEPARTARMRSVLADPVVGRAAMLAAWDGRALRQGYGGGKEAASVSLLRTFLGSRNAFEAERFEEHLRKFVKLAMDDCRARRSS